MTFATTTLSPEAIEFRKTGIGASEVAKIMQGSIDDVHELWLVKTGKKEREDLSDIFRVQMGIQSEAFNLHWMAKQHPEIKMRAVSPTELPVRSPISKHLLASPDGYGEYIDGQQFKKYFTIDAKHVNGFTNEDKLLQSYSWQMLQQAYCCNVDGGILSPIYGNNWGPIVPVWRDELMIIELVKRTADFWDMVVNDIEPKDPYVPIIIKHDDMRELDMTEGNRAVEWGNAAHIMRADKDGHNRFVDAKKELKEMIPDDAKLAYGNGMQVKRSKANRITITEMKGK